MEKPGFVPVGKITKAHGLKGAVKVHLYGESLETFREHMEVLIVPPDGSEKVYTLKWVKAGNRLCLFSFSDIEDRGQADDLAGSEIYIAKSFLPELDEGTYYWSEIIGLNVYDKAQGYIGRVVSIIPTGANDVYVVRENDKETLIPALQWVVLSIDLKCKVMEVDLPEGC